MREITIFLEVDHTVYKGVLSEVFGAAGKVWHLSINKFYQGQLMMIDGEFVFHGNPKGEKFEQLADWMGTVLISAYQ